MFGKRILSGGYLVEEVISALQKEIRRGDQFKAVYWALSLYKDGYWNAVFNRLKIIVSEDVGMGCPLAPIPLNDLYQEGRSALKGKKLTDSSTIPKCKEVLVKSVILLALAPKSRSCNNLACLGRKDILEKKYGEVNCANPVKPINPDELILEHLEISLKQKDIRKSAALVYSFLFYQDLKASPKRKTLLWEVFWKVCPYPQFRQVFQIFKAWNRTSSLYLMHTINLVCYDNGPVGSTNPTNPTMPAAYEHNFPEPLVIPDYALDKHTARGKKLGRGIAHFKTVGSLVNNEAFPDPYEEEAFEWYTDIESKKGTRQAKSTQISKTILEQEWLCVVGPVSKVSLMEEEEDEKNEEVKEEEKKVKVTLKRKKSSKSQPLLSKKRKTSIWPSWEPVVPDTVPEGSCFNDSSLILDISTPIPTDFKIYSMDKPFLPQLQLVVDAQLPCGWKPRSLIGCWGGRGVFVKGPLKAGTAQVQVWVDSLKSGIEGVNQIGSCVVKALDGEFLVMREIGGGPYPYSTQTKTCKRGDYQVASVLPFYLAAEMFKRPEASIPLWFKEQYVAVLLWRKWLGISDSNNRNIIFKVDIQKVYSIDEMVIGHVKKGKEEKGNPHYSLYSQNPGKPVWNMVNLWLYVQSFAYVQNLFVQWSKSGICQERLARVKNLWENKQLTF